MKTETMEKLYVGIMIGCFLVCLALLLSMIFGRPQVGGAQPHVPTMRDEIVQPVEVGEQVQEPETPVGQTEGQEGAGGSAVTGTYTLTETALQQAMLAALPDNFPVYALEVDVEPEGTLELEVEVKRGELLDYLEDCGVKLSLKQRLLMRFLPKTFEADCVLQMSMEEHILYIKPTLLKFHDSKVNVDGIPESLLTAVGAGLQGVLDATGIQFSAFTCTDDAIVLQ